MDRALFQLRKIFGRTDIVVMEMVDLATDVSTEMLKLALHKLSG